jgi:hypothetical protein
MQPLELRALEAQERYKDLLREAEQRRWLNGALKGSAKPHPARVLYAPLLARLGSLLVALGSRLRARYGALDMFADEGHAEFAPGPGLARRL